MSVHNKIAAASAFPTFNWPTVGGQSGHPVAAGKWHILMVYRGKHCPLCKRHFKELESLLPQFKAMGVGVSAVSADPKEKARADVQGEGWSFPVAYDLSLDDMRKLGLYISSPRSPEETDRPFAEPGMFIINPDGKVQTVLVGNASYSRPDLNIVLAGLKFTIEKSMPVRGTMD